MRITRFARALRALINEYYSDMEVGEAHLNERLTQMGFIMIDERMMVPVEREGQEQEELLEAEKFEEAKENES